MGYPISFGKVYRRLDSLEKNGGLYGSILSRDPSIELIDLNPSFDNESKYIPKKVRIFVSNKPDTNRPTNISQMTLSDEIDTDGLNGTYSNVYSIMATSSFIAFEKENINDEVELNAVEFLISNEDILNNL